MAIDELTGRPLAEMQDTEHAAAIRKLLKTRTKRPANKPIVPDRFGMVSAGVAITGFMASTLLPDTFNKLSGANSVLPPEELGIAVCAAITGVLAGSRKKLTAAFLAGAIIGAPVTVTLVSLTPSAPQAIIVPFKPK